MTQLNLLRGFEDAGQVFTRTPKLISEATLDTRVAGAKKSNLAQYDANSFITGTLQTLGTYNRFVAQAFKVNNDGTISTGNVYEYNMPSGDDSMSSTYMNETAPGVISFIGRMDWSGSYQMVGGTASTTDGNLVSQTGVQNYGDYNTSNNAHPQGGGLVGPGNWTAADALNSRNEAYVGYGSTGQYVAFYSVGSGEYTYQQLDTHSSTTGTCQFLQHYSDTSKRIGWSYNHEDSSDYHLGLIKDGYSYEDLGNVANYTGAAETNYANFGAYTWVDTSNPSDSNNRAFFICVNGKTWEWNKTGSQKVECDVQGYPSDAAGIAGPAMQMSQFMCGKNLVWIGTNSGAALYTITRQTGGSLTRPLYTFTQLGPNLTAEVFHHYSNTGNLSTTGTLWSRMRFCGNNNQFIMIQRADNIKVYDATNLYPTAGDYL